MTKTITYRMKSAKRDENMAAMTTRIDVLMAQM